MIYTLTLNPAIDYVMRFDNINQGFVNRPKSTNIFIGGKGINVSLILNELSVPSTAMGFIAGFTGVLLQDEISSAGIKADFVKLKTGVTRINVKLKGEKETDLNADGPEISSEALAELFKKFEVISDEDTLVLSGSIPKSLPQDMYEQIIKALSQKNIRFVVDAEGQLLLNTLKYHPFLIKPNHHELGDMFGVVIDSPEKAADYAQKLQLLGAQNVLVSMAEKGAVLLDENGNIHIASAIKGKIVNSVGAGDSMVAGFIAGFEKTANFEYALRLGIAAGGATAFSEGLSKSEDILRLL